MWRLVFHDAFYEELMELAEEVQDGVASCKGLLETYGPQLGRPYADTLEGSRYPNMKELRFDTNSGVWRVAFAFDPKRHAVLLVAGNKAEISQKRFYKQLVKKADERFTEWLEQQKGE